MTKNNDEKFWRIVKVIGFIAGIIFTCGIFVEKFNTHNTRLEKIEGKADSNERNIIEMKGDIKYIRYSIDEINRKIDRRNKISDD